MSDPLSNGNFDTFLFEQFVPSNIDEVITGHCLNTVDCYAHGILSNAVHSFDHEELIELMTNPINTVVNRLVNSAAEDIMTVPEEYDTEVVKYFNENGEGYYTLLYMCFLKLIDDMLRHLPNLIYSANQKGIYYDDFRLTRDTDFMILRLIRKHPYAQ